MTQGRIYLTIAMRKLNMRLCLILSEVQWGPVGRSYLKTHSSSQATVRHSDSSLSWSPEQTPTVLKS